MKRTAITRRTPVKKVNRRRKASEFARAYGSKKRVEWIAWLPSVVSGLRPCVNAHVRNGGAGRKADACWIVPLTDDEHRELHQVGKRAFEALHHIDLDAYAMKTQIMWERFLEEHA